MAKRAWAILALCWLTGGAAGAEPLPIEGALQQALRSNPGLQASRAEVLQAHAQYDQAGSIPNGSLVFGASAGQGAAAGTSVSGLPRDQFVQLNQPFPPMGALEKARFAAGLRWKEAELRLALARVALVRQTKDAFYNLLAAQNRLDILRTNMELATKVYDSLDKTGSNKVSRRLELLAARVQRNQVKQALVQGEGERRSAQADLLPLLGQPDQGASVLVPDPRGEQEGHLADVVRGELDTHYERLQLRDVEALARSSPYLEAARLAWRGSQADVEVAAAQGRPSTNLTAIYDFRLPSYVVGAQLSIPLDWGQIGYDVEAKRAVAQAQEARLRAAQLDVSARVRKAFATFQAGVENSANFVAEVLNPQEEAVQLTQAAFERKQIDYDVLLLAQVRLEEVRLEYIRQRLAERQALNALEEAVGLPIEPLPPDL